MAKSTTRKAAKPVNFRKLIGTWRSHGYGTVLEIKRESYTLYEETGVSCLPVFHGTIAELAEHYVDVKISPQGRAFSVRRAAGIARLRFRRLSLRPENCSAMDPGKQHDPQYNFEVLWHTFAEHYALFELRGVDWHTVYHTFRPKVHADTSPERLFEIFAAMLRPLRDGHVQLHTPYGHFTAAAAPPIYDRLETELGDGVQDVPAHLAGLREGLWETIHEDYLGARSRRAGNGLLEWGQLNDSTGYLAIRAMAGQSGKAGRPRADLEVVDDAMSRVVDELGELPAIVVDLRGNAGGYDVVALRLASYLLDRRRMAFSKAARRGDGFTGTQPIYVDPAARPRYRGRVVILTSGLTASAAEVFLLALLKRPHVSRIGETTHGILSDALERHLPNGWFVTLSNELYLASDGELYEDRGVPPHVEIPYLHPTGRKSGRDQMLEYVLNAPQ